MKRTKIAVLLIGGLAVREVLAPFTGHPYDFELWVRLGYYVSLGFDPYAYHVAVYKLSLPAYYDPTWPGYPPLWPLFLALIYKLYTLTAIQNRFLYYFLIKQPMVVADVLDAYLIFKLVRLYSENKNAIRALAFWLLCPYTILISSIWGIFDQIVLLFVLLSLFAISSTWKSSPLESLAIALKLIPAIYFPLFVGIQPSWKRRSAYLAIGTALFLFLTLFPYLIFENWNLHLLLGVGYDDANKFANSMNYWEVLISYVTITKYAVPPFLASFLRGVGLLWIAAILIATYFCLRRIRSAPRHLLQRGLIHSSLFITLVFFLTKSVVNEQFLIYFLAFGVVDYFAFSNRRRRRLFHLVWLTALVFLIVNNEFLTIFLDPISQYYQDLANSFLAGDLEAIRLALMAVVGVVFSVFAFSYLRDLYSQLKKDASYEPAPSRT